MAGPINKVRLSKSSISEYEKKLVADVLDAEYLGMGATTKEFEENVAKFLNLERKSVVSVNTGTSALHISLLALGIGTGDEVLVPSLTYIASFQAISATGATPVACEVNPETLFLDSKDAEKRITNNTKAIMAVHYASNRDGIECVYDLSDKYGLRVIEDAAQSFGSHYKGRLYHQRSDIVCYSFDGIKNITCGEGGAVVSNDIDITDLVRDIRLLGIEKDTEKRFDGARSWDYDVQHQGFRYHMSNINAAIGIAQLTRISQFKERRQLIAQAYVQAFEGSDHVRTMKFNFDDILPHIFVIKVSQRDKLKKFLEENGVECGIHYKPNHLLSLYNSGESLPVTEYIYNEVLTLPCHIDLTDDELRYIIFMIKKFFGI